MRSLLVSWALLAAASAAAQTVWNNPAGGLWSNPANWTPANVPDSAAESALIDLVGTYSIDLDITAALGGLAITEANATVNLLSNRAIFYSGSTLTNDGQFIVNAAGVNNTTYVQLNTSTCLLDGAGLLRLNANGANLDTAFLGTLNGGYVLTNALSHTVAGTGRIRVGFSNEGLVSADVLGAPLEFADSAKANSGTMQAIGGGTLRFSGVGVDNSGGLIVADGAGSIVAINSSSITGGVLDTANGGAISSSQSTLADLTNMGTLNFSSNSHTSLAGTILTNDGSITINPSGANSVTYMQLDTPAVAIDGTGTINLNANTANPDTAHLSTVNGSYVLTLGAGQTVRGNGRIRVNTTNEGMIQADVSGALLELTQQAKTNDGIMRAIGGGVLQINGIGVDNTNGEVRAEAASTVSLVNAGVTGGLLSTTDDGVIAASNSGIAGVTINGTMQVSPNSALAVSGSCTNNGVLTINPTGVNNTTYMRLDTATATFDGTGTIHLNANAANPDTAHIATLNGSYVLTVGADQTVDGTGRIRTNVTNEGTIDANVGGRSLELIDQPKTNNGLMRASNGGTLQISSIGVTNNTQIVSDGPGSAVNMTNATISGGELGALNGASNAVQNSTFADVTVTGPVAVSSNTALAIAGSGITNDSVVTVNPTAINNNTYIRLDVPNATLAGTGSVRLNANGANLDTAHLATINGAYVLTQAPTHTIAGSGRIRVALANEGTVDADVAGATLEFTDQPKTNHATMRARGGGNLSFSSVGVDNTGGEIVADGASSTVWFVNTGVTGGTIAAHSGGVTNSANSAFNGVTITGPHNVAANTYVGIHSGGITNNGTITINPTQANQTTYALLYSSGAMIDGNGEIQLNANPANPDTAHLAAINGAYQLTLGPAQSLTGNGRVRVHTINHGRLAPGSLADQTGTIDMQGIAWTQAADSQYAVDLGGAAAGEYDRVTGNATVTLDGTLLVGLVDSFVPAYGSEFPILTCGSLSGAFSDIFAPALGGDDQWRVRYTANSATLVVTCRFDLDGDFVVGLADLSTLLAHFGMTSGATERDGDLDSDGDVDLEDLANLISRFGLACH